MNTREQAFFRFLAGQQLSIEPHWGMTQIQQVLMLQALNEESKQDEFCLNEKNKTQSTAIYHNKEFVGNFDQLDDIKPGSVAVVSMSGTMMVQDAMCSYGMKSMDNRLRTLYRDNRIQGIVLDIDTGGGYSTAGDILFSAIKDKNKPVIALATFLASAGVKGTLAADEIIAISSSTNIGSIGTMMVMPKWYIEQSKEDDIELYSRTSQKKNAPWRALKNGDFEPYIDALTKNDEAFMSQVKKYRNLKGSRSTIKETLSGEVFLANDAKARGLIDSIGSLNHAFKRVDANLKYYK